MTDAMKELYEIFKEDFDQEVLEKSKNKWIKEGVINRQFHHILPPNILIFFNTDM